VDLRRLSAEFVRPVSEVGVIDDVIEAGNAIGWEAELLEVAPMGEATGDGGVKERADKDGLEPFLPGNARMILGRALSHEDGSAVMEPCPESGCDSREGVVAGDEDDIGVELREVSPKLTCEAELPGICPAALGHKGVDGELGRDFLAELEAGMDADAADELNAADAAGKRRC